MPVSVIENASFGNSGIVTANGIKFPATQVASADANTLDDYEEGTWTPIDASGASLSFSNTSGNCLYTKVGKVVTACFRVTYPSTANTSFAYIGGLPFTSAVTSAGVQGVAFSEQSIGGDLMGNLQVLDTRFILLGISGGSVIILTNANASTKDIRGSITYIAAS